MEVSLRFAAVLAAILMSVLISGSTEDYECYQNICLKSGPENGTFCLVNGTCEDVKQCQALDCTSEYSNVTKQAIDSEYVDEILTRVQEVLKYMTDLIGSTNPDDWSALEKIVQGLLGPDGSEDGGPNASEGSGARKA